MTNRTTTRIRLIDTICLNCKKPLSAHLPGARCANAALTRFVETPAAIRLTPRETDIVRLSASGKGRRDIAAALGIADRTAAVHLLAIYAKIGISGRGAGPKLTAWGIAHGYGPGGARAA